MLDLNDFRWSALARYHDDALEHAVVLLALARMPIKSHWDIADTLGVRVTIRTMNEMHNFAFKCRKAIEIADRITPGVKKAALAAKAHAPGDSVEVDLGEIIPLTDKDFWWIISRIMHSQSVHVQDVSRFDGATQTRIYSTRWGSYFGFISDHDMKELEKRGGPNSWRDGMNFVSIEQLVSCYVGGISRDVENAIAVDRPRAGV